MTTVRALTRSWTGRLGLGLVAIIVVAVLVSLVWVPHDPTRVVPSERWLPISGEHWFGTDGAGKDLFSQVLVGARTTLVVALASAAIAGVVGLVLGLLAAVLPRLVGDAIGYLVDVLIALPVLVLALVLVALFQGSLLTVSVAIGAGSGVALARVVRGEAESVLTRQYVTAATTSGSSTTRTVLLHVVPNILPMLIVQLSLVAALAVLAEAALSYLGLTPVSTPSWGRMLQSLQSTVSQHPGAIVFPGLAVVLTTLGFNLLGDALRDATDPRLRGAE
jgi:peptide/nickel transport system permease protein